MITNTQILVFDIETIIDAKSASRYLDLESVEPGQARAALQAHEEERTGGRTFLPKPPFHQVVAISVLVARLSGPRNGEQIEVESLASRSADADTEAELLRWFFDGFEQLRPRLVSFNGRGFDLPVLKYRAMRHGVRSPLLHDVSNKWENYGSRYAADWHCDLLDVLSDYGASTRIKLQEICAVLGLPGKLGIDGSKVATYFDEGCFGEIAGYCETDVLNTFLVYLRMQHHKGRMTTEGYNAAIAQLRNFLRSIASERQHVWDFGTAWKEASGPELGAIAPGV